MNVDENDLAVDDLSEAGEAMTAFFNPRATDDDDEATGTWCRLLMILGSRRDIVPPVRMWSE